MASIADAVLEDLPAPARWGGGNRGSVRLYDGRWNSRGLRVVYASTSLALAAVETFVNLEPNLQPKDLVSIEGEVPDELKIGRLDPRSLPSNWHETGNEALRRFGDEWIRAGRTVALLVPSMAIRGEWNVLLNPAEIHFRRIKFGEQVRFRFDARMFRQS